jgi:hypothetical protein
LDLGEIEHLVGGFACSSSGVLHARFGIEFFSGWLWPCPFFLPATVPVNVESVTDHKVFQRGTQAVIWERSQKPSFLIHLASTAKVSAF